MKKLLKYLSLHLHVQNSNICNINLDVAVVHMNIVGIFSRVKDYERL